MQWHGRTARWLAALLLGLAVAAAAKGDGMVEAMRAAGLTFKTAQWTNHITHSQEDGTVTKDVSRIWISGNKLRLEVKDRKTGDTMILIDDGRRKLFYNPKEKTAMAMNPMMEGMFSGFFNSETFAQAARNRAAGKTIGNATIDGKPCTIYAYPSNIGQVTSQIKEWVWNGKQFPVKSIVTTPGQTITVMGRRSQVPGSTTEALATDIVFDRPIPASQFALPDGVTVSTMPGPRRTGGDEDGEDGSPEDMPENVPPDVKEMMKKLF